MEIKYIRIGDYYFPDLKLPDNSQQPIGKYGRMRMAYLKEHRPSKLNSHLIEIEQTCQERLERMIPQMKKAEGVTEALKAADQMEWLRRMNSIHDLIEEILLTELIYA